MSNVTYLADELALQRMDRLIPMLEPQSAKYRQDPRELDALCAMWVVGRFDRWCEILDALYRAGIPLRRGTSIPRSFR